MQQLPDKAVLLSEAVAAITNYRLRIKNDPEPHLHAFLLVHSDIMNVLEMHDVPEMKYDRFRGYLGLKENEGTMEWHFYVCPVDSSVDQNDIILKLDDGTPYVYDFNTPCPTTCAQNYSPLNDIRI